MVEHDACSQPRQVLLDVLLGLHGCSGCIIQLSWLGHIRNKHNTEQQSWSRWPSAAAGFVGHMLPSMQGVSAQGPEVAAQLSCRAPSWGVLLAAHVNKALYGHRFRLAWCCVLVVLRSWHIDKAVEPRLLPCLSSLWISAGCQGVPVALHCTECVFLVERLCAQRCCRDRVSGASCYAYLV